MTTNIKRTKIQNLLDKEQTKEMLNYLREEKGSCKKLANELGVTPTSVSGWKRKGEFPKYCAPFLKLNKIKKGF